MSRIVGLLLLLVSSAAAVQVPVSDSAEPSYCGQPILFKKPANTPLKLLLLGNGFLGPIALELERQAKETGLWSSVKIVNHTATDSFLRTHLEHLLMGDAPRKEDEVDAVILQEQSQVPGFWGVGRGDGNEAQPLFTESVDSLKEIAKILKKVNVPMGLLQTWGYRDGDSSMGPKVALNSELFSSYTEMQNRITKGSRIMEAVAQDDATNGRVHVVPVGEVMRRVHGSDAADFPMLYVEDGAHDSGIDGKYLSADGNFLAAATFLRSLTGRRPKVAAASELQTRLLAAIPDGAGPCDGNPQFSSIENSGAKTEAISALILLGLPFVLR